MTLLLAFTFCNCLFHYSNAEVKSFGFQVAPNAQSAGSPITTTLHWNKEMLQCTLYPITLNAWLYCDAASSRCETASTEEYKMNLDILGTDGVWITAVQVIEEFDGAANIITWNYFCSSLSFPSATSHGKCESPGWTGTPEKSLFCIDGNADCNSYSSVQIYLSQRTNEAFIALSTIRSVLAFPYYTKLPGLYTWYEAKQACQDYGTDLATIKDSTDNSRIRSLCGYNNNCWIGYTTQNNCGGCWYWLGEHTSTYADWQAGHPAFTDNACAYYNYYYNDWYSNSCSTASKYYAICNPLTEAPTLAPTAAPSINPTTYGNDCEDRGYIYHYNWDNTSLGQHPYFDYQIDIDESDLSVRFEANLEYIGHSTAKSQYGLGSTYVLDFAPFDGFNDHINEPRNCSNRLSLSFVNRTFSEYWRYSTTPYNLNHYGTLDYLAYPPSGDKWSLTMGYGNPWIECARVKYVAHFNWVELNKCQDNEGNSLMDIDVDSNFITLSGRFYIDLVSPKSNDKELDVYYVKPLLQKSFAMKISRSVQIIDSANIESFLITIYQSHRLFDSTDSTYGSHLIRISTQIAHYMQLTSPLVITSPTYQWQIRNIVEEQCVFERDSICTQYWDVYMVRSVECPLEFSGLYHLHFSAICNLEVNDTESCDDYIRAYNGTVELEFILSYSDPFKCNDTQVEDILFDASMLFYNDVKFTDLVNNGDQFRSGIDVIYGQVVVDIPANLLSIFEVSLLNIWICTVDANLENYVEIDENEIFTGCFDSTIIDAGSTTTVMINGESQIHWDAHLINSENETNIVRYSFLAPAWMARDTLYVHCEIKISLIDHIDRRLLIDSDENVVDFGNIQSIVHVIEGVLIDIENHANATKITIVGEDDAELSSNSHIDLMTVYVACVGIAAVIMVLIMVICCMFFYMKQKRVNDENLMTHAKSVTDTIVTQKRVSETQD